MRKKVLSPSELIEFRTQQQEEAKIRAAKLEDENKNQKPKRFLSPSDLLDPKPNPVEEEIIEIEIKEKPKDLIEVLQEKIEEVSANIKEPKFYDEEISQVNTVIKEIKKSIPKVPKVKYYDDEIQSIFEKLDSLDIRYYESDLQIINERLDQLQDLENKNKVDVELALKQVLEDIDKLYHLEILDPKETHEYIDSIKEYFQKKVEQLKVQLSELPEVKYYDNELRELQEEIETVRGSLSEIPEIKYYDEELSSLIEKIEEVKCSITKLPEVRYYENEIYQLEESIKDIESRLNDLPEIKHYDSHIDKLNESIKNVEDKIPNLDNKIQNLGEIIEDVKHKVSEVPEVKYYDTEIFEVNDTLEKVKKDIYQIQKFVENINIPEQIDWSGDIQNIHKEIEKLKEVPLISESVDPLIPLDQNFATLDDLQNHYKLFINRIQQQLATIGGGGETRLEFLDDIDRDTAKINNKFLKYDALLGKWVGSDVSGGGGGGESYWTATTSGIHTLSNVGIGITSSEDYKLYVQGDAFISGNISVAGTVTYDDVTNVDSLGIITARQDIRVGRNLSVIGITTLGSSNGIGTVTVGIGETALYVDGSARVVGILTVGRSSVTIDGDNNTITAGNVLITGSSVTIGDNVTINSTATGINSAPNVIYVAKDGNDSKNGTSIDNAKSTIAGAIAIAQTGTTIKVLSGTYNENNPIEVPSFVSIVGDNLKTVTVVPNNSTQDIFYVNKGSYISNMTFVGHVSPAAAIAFPPSIASNVGGGSWESPYIQNCTSNTTTGTGMRIDGNLAEGLKSMVVDSYTQYNQGGVGIAITNNGYAQLVSVFTICCNEAISAYKGGQCSITNSNSNFGTYGLVAEGISDLQFTGIVTSSASVGTNLVTVAINTSTRPYEGQVLYFDTLYYTIENITVTNGGSGYVSTPSVTIGTPTGPNGSTATAFATLDGDRVSEITIISSGSQYLDAPSITISAPDSGTTATASANISPIYYTINSSTPVSSGITTITLDENLNNTIGIGITAYFYQVSRITASSHTFEYVGAGNDIASATPLRGGVPIQENEVVSRNGGRVVFTSTDQAGNFRIGNDIVINQNNGTISGRAFTRSLFNQMTPFILALT
jgi:hypothetical protein